MATTNGNKSDWVTLLQEANSSRCDRIPVGYKPAEAWIKEFSIGETTFRRNIKKLVDAKVMDRKEFRADVGGRLLKRPYWKRIKI